MTYANQEMMTQIDLNMTILEKEREIKQLKKKIKED
jgi:hypothetical protein